jgi:hypothetical protein
MNDHLCEDFGEEEEDMPVPHLLAGAAPACPCHQFPLQLPRRLASVSAPRKQESDKKLLRLAKHVSIKHMTRSSPKGGQKSITAEKVGCSLS